MKLLEVLAEKSQLSDANLTFSNYVSEPYSPLRAQNAFLFSKSLLIVNSGRVLKNLKK